MKKVKVAIPEFMVLFYYPIALMFLCMIANALLFGGMDVHITWLKYTMVAVGGLLNILGLAAAVYMLYELGKSIVEDIKGKKDDV